MTDPYAPSSARQLEDAPALVTNDAGASALHEAPTAAVPAGTSKAVLDWVGDDQERAVLARDAELAGQNRNGLLYELNKIVDQ